MTANRFTAMLARQARRVFMDKARFAAALVVDGREVTAMWEDSVRPGTDSGSGGFDEGMYGVNIERRLLLVLDDGTLPRPRSGQELCVAGDYWLVGPVRDRAGIFEIELSRNVS